MARFTSRKFIMALAAQVVALLAVIMPEHADAVEAIVTNAAALVVSVGSAIGYVTSEASVDRERARRDQ